MAKLTGKTNIAMLLQDIQTKRYIQIPKGWELSIVSIDNNNKKYYVDTWYGGVYLKGCVLQRFIELNTKSKIPTIVNQGWKHGVSDSLIEFVKNDKTKLHIPKGTDLLYRDALEYCKVEILYQITPRERLSKIVPKVCIKPIEEIIQKSMKSVQDVKEFMGKENIKAPENSGLSCDYYKVDIKDPTTEENPPYTAECNDIIEALGMNYAEGNIFKEIWRSCAARTLGKLKEGHTEVRGAEKILFFAQQNYTAKTGKGVRK